MKKWIVTLEITVEAETKMEAFEAVEGLLLPYQNFMLYDADEAEVEEEPFVMKYRICCNSKCGKVTPEQFCLDYKRPVGARLCPECYEVTEEWSPDDD